MGENLDYRSGSTAGETTALDVFATEPATDSPLFNLPNVVVTPHLGASTSEAQDRAGTDVAKSVRLALAEGVVLAPARVVSSRRCAP